MSFRSIDLFAHSNPAFAAAVVRWTSEGFAEQRRAETPAAEQGLFPLWALYTLALVGTPLTFADLPLSSNARLRNLFHVNPLWRPALATGAPSWSGAFWRGVGFGCSSGVLRYQGGLLYPRNSIGTPVNTWSRGIRRRSRAMGKVMAKEPDRLILSTMLGLNVVVAQ